MKLALVLAVALGTAAVAGQQDATFHATARTVPIYTTVTGPDGRLVLDLKKADFQLLDQGVPQAISLFVNDVQPITMVVMLDVSGSMSGNLPLLRSATAQLAAHLGKDDKARLGWFGDNLYVMPGFTNNADDLIRSLWEDMQPGGMTPLWRAINAAMTALENESGRRVVLVFTDGYDTSSRETTLEMDMTRAQDDSFMIYSVGLRSSMGRGGGGRHSSGRGGGSTPGGGHSGARADGPDPGLQLISAATGGGYFELESADHLNETFTRVIEELRHQYILGFVPSATDGRLHTLEVRMTSPTLTARARKTYLANGK